MRFLSGSILALLLASFALSACGEKGSFADVGTLVDTGEDDPEAGLSDTETSTLADAG